MKVRVNYIKIYAFVIALVVVSRSFSTKIFISSTIEMVVIGIVTLLGLSMTRKSRNMVDFIWLLMPLMYFFNHNTSYELLFIIIFLSATCARYIFRTQIDAVEIMLDLMLIFSIITSVATWISVISPGFYTNSIVPFLDSASKSEILRELNQGNLCGLTTHYSRNAYYVVFGLITLLSRIWSGGKTRTENFTWYILMIFETITLLAIGKRGHLVFWLIALYIVYILMQRNAFDKVKNSLKLSIAVVVIGLAIFYFFPDARHTFERFFAEAGSDDFSNGRLMNYAVAMDVFMNKPIFGIGIGGFRTLTNNVYAGVHNDYIQFLCETGIIGFVLFVGLEVFSLYEAGSLLRKTIINSVLSAQMKTILIWSMFFQLFVFFYAFTGLPHFDYEINTVYLIACAVPSGIKYKIKKDSQ